MDRVYLKTHNYDIVKTYTPEEIKAHGDKEFFYDKEVTPKKIKLWRAKVLNQIGYQCVEDDCNLKDFHFGLGIDKGGGIHLDLYGYDDEGDLVMITLDHIRPKSKGGSNDISNFAPLCKPHNEMKANVWEEEVIEIEFLSYEDSKEMKELGFDEICFGYFKHEDEFYFEGFYKNSEHGFSIARPLYSQVFKWFRDKHNLEGEVKKRWRWSRNAPNPNETFYDWSIHNFTLGRENSIIHISGYDSKEGVKPCETYEIAQLACLKKLIDIVKSSK